MEPRSIADLLGTDEAKYLAKMLGCQYPAIYIRRVSRLDAGSWEVLTESEFDEDAWRALLVYVRGFQSGFFHAKLR